jgi:hypothetical protein
MQVVVAVALVVELLGLEVLVVQVVEVQVE